MQAIHPVPMDDLIDREQTANFAGFCRALHDATRRNPGPVAEIRRLEGIAQAHFSRLALDAVGTKAAILQIARTFSQQQLKELRRTAPLSRETGDVIVKNI